MRVILSFLILSCLIAPALAADSPAPTSPEQALKDRAKAFDAAWNKHDAEAVAAHFTINGDIVTESGETLSGRDGIQQALTDGFNGQLKDSTLTSTIGTVRLIKPDVAIVDSDVELKTGDAEPRKFHVVNVVIHKDGKWLTETTRAIVYRQQ